MAILTWKNGSEVLHFDVTLSEGNVSKSEATKFPTEKGADFTDHVKVNASEVALKVFVSNSPLKGLPKAFTDAPFLRVVRDTKRLSLHADKYDRPPGPTPGAVVVALVKGIGDELFGNGPDFKLKGSALSVESPVASFSARKATSTDDRRIELVDKLEKLRATRELVDVFTSIGYYPECWLTGIDFERTKPTDGLEIKLTFDRANVTETRQVQAPKTRVSRAKAPEVKGAPSEPKKSPADIKTLAKKALGAIGL